MGTTLTLVSTADTAGLRQTCKNSENYTKEMKRALKGSASHQDL